MKNKKLKRTIIIVLLILLILAIAFVAFLLMLKNGIENADIQFNLSVSEEDIRNFIEESFSVLFQKSK